jgi:hypothetical protein
VDTNFCRLTDTSGVEIVINPSTVRYLVAGSPGTTRVCFDSVHTVNVRGSPREVQGKLSGDAMNVRPRAGDPSPEISN